MNLPNKLSFLRIVLVPVMAIFYVINIPLGALYSVIIFILAAFTDFLDGYIARKYNMVTDLGKLLDPIADKLLVLFGLFLVVEANILPIGIASISAGIIIGREFLISAVRQIAATKGTVIQANGFGKLKTISQDVAIPLLMLFKLQAEISAVSITMWNIVMYLGYIFFGLAVFMTILSGAIYMYQNRKVFETK